MRISQAQSNILLNIFNTPGFAVQIQTESNFSRIFTAISEKNLVVLTEGHWRVTESGLNQLVRYGRITAEQAAQYAAATEQFVEAATEPDMGEASVTIKGRKFVTRYSANLQMEDKLQRKKTLLAFADAAGWRGVTDLDGATVKRLFEEGLIERPADVARTEYQITHGGLTWLKLHE